MTMPQSSPDTVVAIEDKALSKEDVIDILSDESEPEALELDKEKKEDKKDTKKEEEQESKDRDRKDDDTEDDEKERTLEEELEEELAEPDDDKLELVTPIRRKEILAKYPDIFKDFPFLENSYYRERAFTEIFPAVQDAKLAAEKAQTLDTYEAEIMGGSTESLLRAVKEGDGEAFNKVVDNYLTNLHKIDEGAYYHTIGNVIKHTIMSMVRDAKEAGNDDLLGAADILNQYIFATKTFTPPQRLSRQENTQKDDEVSEREKQFVERQFKTAESSVNANVNKVLRATVEKYIDPNGSMTDYVKRNAVREALEDLENIIGQDSRFQSVKDRLWEKAFELEFDGDSTDKIEKAYLSKAKTLLAGIIKKHRNEALKGLGKRVKSDEEENNNGKQRDKKGPLPVGKARSSTTSQSSGRTDREKAKSIPRGTSTLDYLMQD
jgi:hypothetical protein